MTHKAGIIHTWTFDQKEKWVDIKGVEHDIQAIDLSYAVNILVFLLRSASRFRRAYLYHHVSWQDRGPESDFEWLESKPLVQALKQRIAGGSTTAFKVKGA